MSAAPQNWQMQPPILSRYMKGKHIAAQLFPNEHTEPNAPTVPVVLLIGRGRPKNYWILISKSTPGHQLNCESQLGAYISRKKCFGRHWDSGGCVVRLHTLELKTLATSVVFMCSVFHHMEVLWFSPFVFEILISDISLGLLLVRVVCIF
jgi:hypothetical protein